MNYGKAGCENPATSQRSEVIATKHVMPSAAMAGSFSRKIPGKVSAGQDVAGEANQVKIAFGGGSIGKQTWKGAREGYTVHTAPKYKAAISTPEHSGGAKQNVKGKMGKSTPAEAKQVSGRKQ